MFTAPAQVCPCSVVKSSESNGAFYHSDLISKHIFEPRACDVISMGERQIVKNPSAVHPACGGLWVHTKNCLSKAQLTHSDINTRIYTKSRDIMEQATPESVPRRIVFSINKE